MPGINILDRVQECGNVIYNTTGRLRSPDYDGDGMYDDNLACRWTIVVEPRKIVQLVIIEFQLEQDPWCRFDHLKVSVVLLYCCTYNCLVYFRLNQLPNTIHWKSLISVLGMSGYVV